MEDAVFEVATAAYDHLLTARSLLSSVPPAAFPVLLAAVSFINIWLILRRRFNPLYPGAQYALLAKTRIRQF